MLQTCVLYAVDKSDGLLFAVVPLTKINIKRHFLWAVMLHRTRGVTSGGGGGVVHPQCLKIAVLSGKFFCFNEILSNKF